MSLCFIHLCRCPALSLSLSSPCPLNEGPCSFIPLSSSLSVTFITDFIPALKKDTTLLSHLAIILLVSPYFTTAINPTYRIPLNSPNPSSSHSPSLRTQITSLARTSIFSLLLFLFALSTSLDSTGCLFIGIFF